MKLLSALRHLEEKNNFLHPIKKAHKDEILYQVPDAKQSSNTTKEGISTAL